ncbi:MAG: 8-amino-7-oxononanoate synthase [Leeuwenhoekiella sp.]
MLPKKLQDKLNQRQAENALRKLAATSDLIDFSSNDYLGFAKSETIFFRASEILKERNLIQNGATGSRLLSGNHPLYPEAEAMIASIHKSEAALIFNSGYDANVGFFSCVPQRGDVILYDEFAHASIRDGIRMSMAKAYKFPHNDLEELNRKCQAERSRSSAHNEIYLITESVFSMDGDSPDLSRMAEISINFDAKLIVDEAHALGVLGEKALGLVDDLNLSDSVFARLITFGKALGGHGAAILGSELLKSYLVNFSRSLIYTTGLPPHSLATVMAGFEQLQRLPEHEKLGENIVFFRSELEKFGLQNYFLESQSAIQSAIILGNERVKAISQKLKEEGFDVKPILSPTVPAGSERLRFCLHSYNTQVEISEVLRLLATFAQV